MSNRNDLFTYTYVREDLTDLVFNPLTEPTLEIPFPKSTVDTSASSLTVGNQYLLTKNRGVKKIAFQSIS
jgi:hypothetical protein